MNERTPAPRLRALVRSAREESTFFAADGRPRSRVFDEREGEAFCDLCARPLGPAHRHMVDLEARKLLCTCRPCALLFDRDAAGGDRFRLVPEEVRFLDSFRLGDAEWETLGIPVELAFFFRSTEAERVVALYPGPMGVTEAHVGSDRWTSLVGRNPPLGDLRVDVEALLVDRRSGAAEAWRVPVDACYRLAGIIRTTWKGLAGGPEVWGRIDEFFEEMARRASSPPLVAESLASAPNDGEEPSWP